MAGSPISRSNSCCHNGTAAGVPPWEGVSVVDASGRTVIDLERDGERFTDGDPYAVCSKPLAPGVYFLRLTQRGLVATARVAVLD